MLVNYECRSLPDNVVHALAADGWTPLWCKDDEHCKPHLDEDGQHYMGTLANEFVKDVPSVADAIRSVDAVLRRELKSDVFLTDQDGCAVHWFMVTPQAGAGETQVYAGFQLFHALHPELKPIIPDEKAAVSALLVALDILEADYGKLTGATRADIVERIRQRLPPPPADETNEQVVS